MDSEVVQLRAVDGDSGENGRLTYRIVNQVSNPEFSLDPVTGSLTIARTLDRETTPQYNVRRTIELYMQWWQGQFVVSLHV